MGDFIFEMKYNKSRKILYSESREVLGKQIPSPPTPTLPSLGPSNSNKRTKILVSEGSNLPGCVSKGCQETEVLPGRNFDSSSSRTRVRLFNLNPRTPDAHITGETCVGRPKSDDTRLPRV